MSLEHVYVLPSILSKYYYMLIPISFGNTRDLDPEIRVELRALQEVSFLSNIQMKILPSNSYNNFFLSDKI